MVGSNWPLSSRTQAALHGAAFVAKRRLRGDIYGNFGRNQRTAGTDFVQYRGYEQGDDPRAIDWKLWARSDRLFVRETEGETRLKVWFVLDDSASMFIDDFHTNTSRWQAVLKSVAALQWVAEQSHALYGLLYPQPLHVRPRLSHGMRHAQGFQRDVLAIHCNAAKTPASSWVEYPQSGDIVVVVTDGFDDALHTHALQAARLGGDVRVLQWLCSQERDLPVGANGWLHDPESERRQVLGAAMQREAYRGNLHAHQIQRLQSLQAVGGAWISATVGDGLADVCRLVLNPQEHHP